MSRAGWWPLLPLLFAIACAPPDAISVEDTDVTPAPDPAVRIVVPPLSPQPEIGLSADCDLQFDIVVDVDNFTYVAPGVEPDPVDGHGHFHILGGVDTPLDGYYVAPKTQLEHLVVTDDTLQSLGTTTGTFKDFADTGQVFSLVANAAQNNHELLDCATCRSTLEFTIIMGECQE